MKSSKDRQKEYRQRQKKKGVIYKWVDENNLRIEAHHFMIYRCINLVEKWVKNVESDKLRWSYFSRILAAIENISGERYSTSDITYEDDEKLADELSINGSQSEAIEKVIRELLF